MSLILSSCGSKKTVVKNYYLIELTPTHRAEIISDSLPLIDAWCEIAEIRISPAYATRDIALRNQSHQIRYFENHEWAVRPSEAITHMIIDFFSDSNIFKRVATRFWQVIPTYQIQTNINNLEVIQDGRTFYAHLNIELALLDIRADQIIFSHSAVRKKELEKRNLNLLAETISELLFEELSQFSNLIKDHFENER
ncbi:ABC-type transport auxiliary lipoprotein family protein [Natronoflexus pectinivorans]|nr:ABC-type transport auxiliary lipoprotein family protein [Natronoflexus pectinivorans]